MTPLPIDEKALCESLQGSMFEGKIHHYDSIDSTNIVLKRMAELGAAEGTVAIAEEQTGGRGRMCRAWMSEKGENLLFSVLLRPSLSPGRVFVLNMSMALAGCQAIEALTGLKAMIKWPNDIYRGHKKLAGILTEFSAKGEGVAHVIVGMGLNVHWNPEMDDALLYPASSILVETGQKISREKLLVMILLRLEGLYKGALANGRDMERMYRQWNDRSLVSGRKIVILAGNEAVAGTGEGIDYEGSLILRTEDGRKRKFVCGDVSVKME